MKCVGSWQGVIPRLCWSIWCGLSADTRQCDERDSGWWRSVQTHHDYWLDWFWFTSLTYISASVETRSDCASGHTALDLLLLALRAAPPVDGVKYRHIISSFHPIKVIWTWLMPEMSDTIPKNIFRSFRSQNNFVPNYGEDSEISAMSWMSDITCSFQIVVLKTASSCF